MSKSSHHLDSHVTYVHSHVATRKERRPREVWNVKALSDVYEAPVSFPCRCATLRHDAVRCLQPKVLLCTCTCTYGAMGHGGPCLIHVPGVSLHLASRARGVDNLAICGYSGLKDRDTPWTRTSPYLTHHHPVGPMGP